MSDVFIFGGLCTFMLGMMVGLFLTIKGLLAQKRRVACGCRIETVKQPGSTSLTIQAEIFVVTAAIGLLLAAIGLSITLIEA